MFVLALAAVVGFVGAGSLLVGAAVVTRHRATAAADLAALAVADSALAGAAQAWATGGRIAGAAGATLVRCSLVGDVADVTCTARFPPALERLSLLGRAGRAAARARAGPASLAPPPPPAVAR